MRHDPTPAEKLLWAKRRNHQIGGLKFRRQMPLGCCIVDFYCASARLVVELDGISHIDSWLGAARDAWMRSQGLLVQRFANREVPGNLDGVLTAISEAARTPPPDPLPQGKGEAPSHPFPAIAHV